MHSVLSTDAHALACDSQKCARLSIEAISIRSLRKVQDSEARPLTNDSPFQGDQAFRACHVSLCCILQGLGQAIMHQPWELP